MEQRSFRELENYSLAELLRELRDDTTSLMRQEIALARAEMQRSGQALWEASTASLRGLLVVYFGAFFMLLAITALLYWGLEGLGASYHLSLFLAPFLVGAGLIAGGVWSLLQAKSKVQDASLEKTAQSLEENQKWLQQKMQ